MQSQPRVTAQGNMLKTVINYILKVGCCVVSARTLGLGLISEAGELTR